MMRILVLCTANSCRSQMAHGYLQHSAGDRAEVHSAGAKATMVDPRAILVMKEDGIDISGHTSNGVEEYSHLLFDHVITVCDTTRETCPWFPTDAQHHHHTFADPAKATGNVADLKDEFLRVRDEIKEYCRQFVAQYA